MVLEESVSMQVLPTPDEDVGVSLSLNLTHTHTHTHDIWSTFIQYNGTLKRIDYPSVFFPKSLESLWF